MLNILESYPLKELGFRSAQAVHCQIEVMRHAYVDRNSYLGDPDFVTNPLDRLLEKGNAVFFTYTLNDWFGAKVMARGAGVLLNNEMDDFTSKIGVPNLYGLV